MKVSNEKIKQIMASATRDDQTDTDIRALCREVLAARVMRDNIGLSLGTCGDPDTWNGDSNHLVKAYDAAREGKE